MPATRIILPMLLGLAIGAFVYLFARNENLEVEEQPNERPTLPRPRRRSSINNSRCMICLDDMNEINKEFMSDCNHVFHRKCMQLWKKRSSSCPICRTPVF